MDNFLFDKAFLLKVNRHKHRQYYAKIKLLDFETEKIIASLEGKVVGGNMSISASSPTRRTGSLQILFDDETKNISETSNLIAIDKKISVDIGISNPFNTTEEYAKYGDILWFPQGVFFITSANSSVSTSTCQISINFIDKMGSLNGICGGVFPASTTLSEILVIDENGNQSAQYPLIKDIIVELVHHFGGEHYSKIMIEDIEDVGRQIVKWNGETPIWFNIANPSQGNFVITAEDQGAGWERYIQGEIIGYMETELTYPGELTMSAGQTVTNALDKIAQTLGNYEYFYDVDGIFHFRKKRNFQATGNTPLNLYLDQDNEFQSLYNPVYNSDSYSNEFLDNELISSINFNPNYSNIKNDFVCWGSGAKSSSNSNSKSNATWVRYHLAIDERPKDIKKPDPTDMNMVLWIGENYSLCHKTIYAIKELKEGEKTEQIIRYSDTASFNPTCEYAVEIAPPLDNIFSDYPDGQFNWREELYRKALLAYGNSTEGSYYDAELLAEWRKIYDPLNEEFKADWANYTTTQDGPWLGYNPLILYAPEKIDYWIDFIDTNTNIGKYSVNRIGRRTSAKVNSDIDKVFSKEIPDIIFVKNTGSQSEEALRQVADNIRYYISIGQTYALMTPDQWTYLKPVNDNGNCYNDARQALYDGIVYNSSVSLTCIPIFYLDVNNIVVLNQVDLGIKGSYTINQISWSLANTKTMNLSLQEAVVVA